MWSDRRDRRGGSIRERYTVANARHLAKHGPFSKEAGLNMQRARDATDIGSVDVQRGNNGRRCNRRGDPVPGVLVLEQGSKSVIISVASPLSKARGQRDAGGSTDVFPVGAVQTVGPGDGALIFAGVGTERPWHCRCCVPEVVGSGMTRIVQRGRELNGRAPGSFCPSLYRPRPEERRMAYYCRLFVPSLSTLWYLHIPPATYLLSM